MKRDYSFCSCGIFRAPRPPEVIPESSTELCQGHQFPRSRVDNQISSAFANEQEITQERGEKVLASSC